VSKSRAEYELDAIRAAEIARQAKVNAERARFQTLQARFQQVNSAFKAANAAFGDSVGSLDSSKLDVDRVATTPEDAAERNLAIKNYLDEMEQHLARRRDEARAATISAKFPKLAVEPKKFDSQGQRDDASIRNATSEAVNQEAQRLVDRCIAAAPSDDQLSELSILVERVTDSVSRADATVELLNLRAFTSTTIATIRSERSRKEQPEQFRHEMEHLLAPFGHVAKVQDLLLQIQHHGMSVGRTDVAAAEELCRALQQQEQQFAERRFVAEQLREALAGSGFVLSENFVESALTPAGAVVGRTDAPEGIFGAIAVDENLRVTHEAIANDPETVDLGSEAVMCEALSGAVEGAALGVGRMKRHKVHRAGEYQIEQTTPEQSVAAEQIRDLVASTGHTSTGHTSYEGAGQGVAKQRRRT
jgi:hypothetical protein